MDKDLLPKYDTLESVINAGDAETLAQIEQTLYQGLLAGQSYTQIERELAKVFESSYYSYERIVRTESNRVANSATFKAYKDAQEIGVEMKKKWVAAMESSRTRPSHRKLNNEPAIGIDEKFNISGDTALYPGQFSRAENSVNCRCTTRSIIDGTDENDYVFNRQSYIEWCKDNGINPADVDYVSRRQARENLQLAQMANKGATK